MASWKLSLPRLGSALAGWCVAGVSFGQAPPVPPKPLPGQGTEMTPGPPASVPGKDGAESTRPGSMATQPAGANVANPAAAAGKGDTAPEASATTTSATNSQNDASPPSSDAHGSDAHGSDAHGSDAHGSDAQGDTDRGRAIEPTAASTVDVHDVSPQRSETTAFDVHEPPLPEPGVDRPRESRKAELGGVVGTVYRPADGGDVTYSAGLAYGGYARVQIREWLTARLMVTQSNHSVEIRPGALGLADTTIRQPDMTLLEMSARAEPTWVVSPKLRVRGTLGVGWGRITVPAPSSSGALEIRTAKRYGVMVDTTAGVSASYDLILDWLSLDLAVDGGLLWAESGSAFDEAQVFDASGHRHFMGGLPNFNGTFSALVGLGVVL